MNENEFIRFYEANGKIEWDRVFKDILRAIYGDEVIPFITKYLIIERNVVLVPRTSF